MPEEDWPLLATILPNRIIMRSIHVNSHAQRYLTPKNGRFTTVIYIDDCGDELLDDAEAAVGGFAGRECPRGFQISALVGLLMDARSEPCLVRSQWPS